MDERVCKICGLIFSEESLGGPFVCPACDCGMYRDGTPWSYNESMDIRLIAGKARRKERKEEPSHEEGGG